MSLHKFLIGLVIGAAASLLLGVSLFNSTGPGETDVEPVKEQTAISLGAAGSVPQAGVPARSNPQVLRGTLFVSAERSGRTEIYALSPGGDWSQVTGGYDPARSPSLSPDGRTLAFQSSGDGNWEIYALALTSGKVTRLTNQTAYDGAPSWSPDGSRLAFESYRSGDLDIWVMNADGSNAVNLTPDGPASDYGPVWSPKGDIIAFTSLESGHKQIWSISTDGKQLRNLSDDQFDEEQPAWSHDGKRIAFVSNAEGCEKVTDRVALDACQRREIMVADWDGNRLQNRRQISIDGHATNPTWSPDGQALAFVSPRPGRQMLFIGSTADDQPTWTSPAALWVRSATWGAAEYRSYGEPDSPPPLYTEEPITAESDAGHAYELRPLKNVYLAPSWGQLSSRVAESFLALRARIQKETGRDFLGVLSDMTRALDSRCGKECDNLSWHKSGRAIDTRLEYHDSNGRSAMEIVREDQSGETFWRVWIRAAVQDGSMGEPLKEQPWDLSDRSRSVLGPDQGGVRSPIPAGYYTDFTDLARLYGWNRISSQDDPEFDWRWNRLAMEYWHYQKTDGLNWYDAVSELYSPAEVSQFEWARIVRDWDVDSLHLYLKGIPPPPDAWRWFALLPRPNK